MGNQMGLTISFANRDDSSRYRSDALWRFPLVVSRSQREENYDELDERTDWTYEAYGVSPVCGPRLRRQVRYLAGRPRISSSASAMIARRWNERPAKAGRVRLGLFLLGFGRWRW
jgi:hypothetical protein